ncbi:hypothetical protein GCM10027065_10800 [Rhodanobacter koreensis]
MECGAEISVAVSAKVRFTNRVTIELAPKTYAGKEAKANMTHRITRVENDASGSLVAAKAIRAMLEHINTKRTQPTQAFPP